MVTPPQADFQEKQNSAHASILYDYMTGPVISRTTVSHLCHNKQHVTLLKGICIFFFQSKITHPPQYDRMKIHSRGVTHLCW